MKLSEIKSKLLERYSKTDYDFSGYRNFNDLVDFIFLHLESAISEISHDKTAVILLLYDRIMYYISTSEHKINKYKICVLIGYIMWKLGYVLSSRVHPKNLDNKEPTNCTLYISVCYYINKISCLEK